MDILEDLFFQYLIASMILCSSFPLKGGSYGILNTSQPLASSNSQISSSRCCCLSPECACNPSKYTAFRLLSQQKSGIVDFNTIVFCVTIPLVKPAALNALKTSISALLTFGCMCLLKLKLATPLVFHVELMFILNNFQSEPEENGRLRSANEGRAKSDLEYELPFHKLILLYHRCKLDEN